MRVRAHLHFLTIYSAVVTAALALTVYFGTVRRVSSASSATDFDHIRVHRIDVVEPDGTPRLFISDRSEFPGGFYHGREVQRHDRSDSAGMLFLNDEGTEDGGLIYGGEIENGKPSSFSHLSFDQYEQDQTIVIGTSFQGGAKAAGVQLNDTPDQPITPDLIAEADKIKAMPHGKERGQAWAALQKKHPGLMERASLSRAMDGSVGLTLRDTEGRSRLEIEVNAAGDPEIRLLDRQGKVKKLVALGD